MTNEIVVNIYDLDENVTQEEHNIMVKTTNDILNFLIHYNKPKQEEWITDKEKSDKAYYSEHTTLENF